MSNSGTVTGTWAGTDTFDGIQVVRGTHSDDTFNGGGGDDRFVGNSGNDSIDGGGGFDTVSYRTEEYDNNVNDVLQGVIVNLSDTTQMGVASGQAIDTHGDTDTLTSIERVDGTTMVDHIYGGSADEEFVGFEGDDVIDGGGGIDTINYIEEQFSGATNGVTVDLSNQTATDTAGDTDTLVNIENVIGTDFADTLIGDDGFNRIQGRGGDDIIIGGDGENHLQGGDGNDTITGGNQDDFINPGTGDDIVDGGGNGQGEYDNLEYYDAEAGITVDKTDRESGTVDGATVGHDTFTNIEIVVGSDYADTFNGSSEDDDFTGNGGADIFNGGDGNDTVVYQKEQYGPNGGSSHGVIVNLSSSDATGVSADGIAPTTVLAHTAIDSFDSVDQLNSIEKIVGTAFADTLIGDGGYNHLEGGSGDDTLIGNGGHDELLGGAGNDTIYGGDDNDFINPGSGNDTIIGGDGGNNYDTLAYFQVGWEGDAAITQGINVDVASGTAIDAWGDTDTYSGIEEFLGTSFVDTFIGDNSGSTFVGMAGNDSFTGGTDDRIDYHHETAFDGGTHGVIANLSDDTLTGVSVAGISTTDVSAHTAIDAFGDTDTITGIGQIAGTDSSDVIVGGDGYNHLEGNGGDDTLIGNGGHDELIGGDGNDTIYGGDDNDFINAGRGDDTIVGGDGGDNYDTLAYFQYSDDSAPTQGIDVNVASGTAADAWGGTDTFSGIEEFQGTGFADTFTGDNSGSVFIGLAGADSFTGGVNDRIAYHGEDFNGALHGVIVNLSDDTLTGVSVAGIATTDVAAHTAIDSFGDTDTITGIGQIAGTNFDDIIVGDAGDNLIDGRDGNNHIQAGDGNDTIYGGNQDDFINPGTGDDTIDGGGDGSDYDNLEYYDATAGITVDKTDRESGTVDGTSVGHDTFSNIEIVVGSDFADTFNGSAQDDDFTGNAGADIFNGGDGSDTVNYEKEQFGPNGGLSHGVVVNLSDNEVSGLSADGIASTTVLAHTAIDSFGDVDQLNSIEWIVGTDLADAFVGDGSGSTFIGLAGADSFAGGVNDRIAYHGEDFNGALHGVIVNLSDDTLTGVSVAGIATTDVAAHTAIDLFGDTDTITGIGQIAGTDSDDIIVGNSGNNTLYGYAGNDTLSGGEGNDTFVGGAGNDTIDGGGDENNAISYIDENGGAGVTVNLQDGTATDTYGDTDTLSNINEVIGTNQADTLVGTDNPANTWYDNGITGLGGDDYIDGQGGFDIAYYDQDAQHGGNLGIHADMAAGTVTDGFGDTDTIVNIEGIRGTQYADTMIGDGGDVNYFQGLAGNNSIDGAGGYDIVDYSKDAEHGGFGGVIVNLDSTSHLGVAAGQATDGFGDTDTLSNIEAVRGTDQADTIYSGTDGLNFQGLDGADTFVGGAGIDTVNYANDAGYGGTNGVTVDLVAGTATDGFGATDTLSGIENIDGSNFADALTGDAGDNVIDGGDGDDLIIGAEGSDTLTGGTGDDTFVYRPGDGQDTITDFTPGAATDDRVDLTAFADVNSLSDLLAIASQDGSDTLIDFGSGDTLRLSGVDMGTLNEDDFVLNPPETVTLPDGGATIDYIYGDPGSQYDAIVGGSGVDTLTISGAATVDIHPSGAGTEMEFDFNNDSITDLTVSGVEDLVINGGNVTVSGDLSNTGLAPNTITYNGDGGDNFFDAGSLTSNEDVVAYGNDGNDTLIGAGGNDTLSGGDGDDQIFGGDGNDVIDGGSGPDDGSDYIVGGAGDDTIYASDEADGVGDFILPGLGNNTIIGTPVYNHGNLDGHDLSFQDIQSGVTADLTTEFASATDMTTTFTNVHFLYGSGFDDTLTGGLQDNFEGFVGNAGDDTIDGGSGWDLVDYRFEVQAGYFDANGDNVVGTQGVVVDLDAGTATDTFGDHDTLISIEEVRGTPFADTVMGSSGDDTFDGYAGDDYYDGRGGFNTIAYNDDIRDGATTGVTVDLVNHTATDSFGGTDTLYNVQHVVGTDYADTLIGDDGFNILEGQGGDDIIIGGDGENHLQGGDGNDTITGGNQDDFINPGTGDDIVDGGGNGQGEYDNLEYYDAEAGITVDKTDREFRHGRRRHGRPRHLHQHRDRRRQRLRRYLQRQFRGRRLHRQWRRRHIQRRRRQRHCRLSKGAVRSQRRFVPWRHRQPVQL